MTARRTDPEAHAALARVEEALNNLEGIGRAMANMDERPTTRLIGRVSAMDARLIRAAMTDELDDTLASDVLAEYRALSQSARN